MLTNGLLVISSIVKQQEYSRAGTTLVERHTGSFWLALALTTFTQGRLGGLAKRVR
jgi:hypothetical protein